jgi:hypothetical protein
MNSPELPTPGTHFYTITKFSSAFKYYGYEVETANTLNSITDNSIVILSNHGLFHSYSDNLWALDHLSKAYPNCIYICWFYHKIYTQIPFKKFILTGEHFYKEPELDSHKFFWNLQSRINNYVPLTFRSNLLPEQVGSFPRNEIYNGCFIGTAYKHHWVSDLQNTVYVTGNNLPEESRVSIFLNSKIAFGFHADDNVKNNVIVERVFEGLAYGCVVISDTPIAGEITNGIVQVATSKEEFLQKYHELLNDETRRRELQEKGLEWVKNNGLYIHTVKNFLDKISSIF